MLCPFYKDCINGAGCDRAMNNELIRAGERWWGSKEFPYSPYPVKPPCHKKEETK